MGSGSLVARQAPEPGSAGTGHKVGAATRARGAQASKLEHAMEREDKRQDETAKYVLWGRVEDWGGAAVHRNVYGAGEEDAGGPQAKNAAHAGCASHGAASTTTCRARVEEGDDG